MALIQKNGGTTNGVTNIAPTLGSATTAGNTILIFVQSAGTLSTPSGFTSRSPQVNQQGFYLFEKLVASGNSTDTPTMAQGGTFNATWQIVEYSGLTAFKTSSGNNGTNLTNRSYATPSITPTAGSTLIVAAVAASAANGVTYGAGEPDLWTNSFTGEQSNAQTGSTGSGRDSLISGFADITVTASGTTAYSTAATYTSSNNAASPASIIAAYTSSGSSGDSGTLAATDTPDTAAIAGDVVDSGSLATTDAPDVAAFNGSVVVSGTLSVTDTADSASLSGSVAWTGTLAATDTPDTASFAGGVLVSGSLSTTDGADTASVSGFVGVSGSLSTTDGTDTASFAGTVGNVVSGSLAVTDTPDTASFAGDVVVSGALATTDNADTAAFAGDVVVAGSMAATDTPDSVFFSDANLAGSLAATEAPDSVSIIGGHGGTGLPEHRRHKRKERPKELTIQEILADLLKKPTREIPKASRKSAEELAQRAFLANRIGELKTQIDAEISRRQSKARRERQDRIMLIAAKSVQRTLDRMIDDEEATLLLL